MSDQARQYEIFGQKLLIETGGNKVGFPGPAAYILESITDDGNSCLLYTSPSPRD